MLFAVLWRVYTGNFSNRYGESMIYQLLLLMLFTKRAVEERPTQGLCLCVNEYMSIARTRLCRFGFGKQSSSKIMCGKTQSIINKCFSAAINM
jgi:hypothetical protein